VLVVGWVRSHTTHDALTIPTGKKTAIQIISACRGIGLMIVQAPGTRNDMIPFAWKSSRYQGSACFLSISTGDIQLQTGVDCNSTRLILSNAVSVDQISMTYHLIPYWWVLSPLTLLSAALLLTPKRQHSPAVANSVEPRLAETWKAETTA
jgi:hypothetical protein